MASKYTDVISYKANIEQIFQTISKQYGKFSNVIDYKENHNDYSISFSYPARGATHREIVHIRLSSAQENITTINITSESIQNEFDCGNNRTHVEMILREVGKTFEAIAISAKTKRNQKSNKIVGIIIAVALIIGCIAVASWLFGGGNGGPSNNECAACHGSGMVNEGFLDFETCPVCHGTGLPPH